MWPLAGSDCEEDVPAARGYISLKVNVKKSRSFKLYMTFKGSVSEPLFNSLAVRFLGKRTIWQHPWL
jgi:hypothetical protein